MPICCQGKNRSQFMFYFLKYLQSAKLINPNNPDSFFVGYPVSGDEIGLISNDYEKSKESNVVLSGFNLTYKSDGFSNSIYKIFGTEYSRAPHIFDLILRNQVKYLSTDIKNLEPNKISQSKFNIYDGLNDDMKMITDLYVKYYLNPSNLIRLTKIVKQKIVPRITWICMSIKSLENLINVFEFVGTQSVSFDYTLVRIIYLGSNDIFQGKNIKSNILDQFAKNIFLRFGI